MHMHNPPHPGETLREDMQHGQLIDDRLMIVNPFL